MSTITYRNQEPGDSAEICRLHRDYLGVDRDETFMHWKYWSNPAGPNRSVVAVDDETGRVVAMIGSVPAICHYFGTPLRCYSEVDVVVAERPDRGRIFFRIYRARTSRMSEDPGTLPVNFTVTIPKTRKIMGKLWNVRPIAPAPKVVRVLRHGTLLGRKISAPLLASAGGFMLDTWHRIRHPMIAPKGLDIASVDAFDASVDRFWDRIRDYAKIWTVRSAAYLNWRYIDMPTIDNRVFVAREGSEIVGYVVVYIWDGDIRRGVIQDFQFLADRKDAGRALLRRAVDFMIGEAADVAVSWTFAHSHTCPVLDEFGFRKRDVTGRTISLRHAAEVPDPWDRISWEESFNPENWHICKGDVDDE